MVDVSCSSSMLALGWMRWRVRMYLGRELLNRLGISVDAVQQFSESELKLKGGNAVSLNTSQ